MYGNAQLLCDEVKSGCCPDIPLLCQFCKYSVVPAFNQTLRSHVHSRNAENMPSVTSLHLLYQRTNLPLLTVSSSALVTMVTSIWALNHRSIKHFRRSQAALLTCSFIILVFCSLLLMQQTCGGHQAALHPPNSSLRSDPSTRYSAWKWAEQGWCLQTTWISLQRVTDKPPVYPHGMGLKHDLKNKEINSFKKTSSFHFMQLLCQAPLTHPTFGICYLICSFSAIVSVSLCSGKSIFSAFR